MRIRHVHRFEFDDGSIIDFRPSPADNPLYRWQVVANGRLTSDGIRRAGGARPNLEMARRFYHRHCARKERCQMGRCIEPHGEVRVLPYRPGDFTWDWLALCHHCYLIEIEDRRAKNMNGAGIYTCAWEKLPLFQEGTTCPKRP